MMNRFTALLVLSIFGFVVALFTGIVIGVSVTSEAKPAEFVAGVIGSVGDWISGLGALAAAAIAVYLADKQRRDSLPKVKITQNADPYAFYIDIVSVGDRSVLLTGVFLRSRKHQGRPRLSRREDFPKRLEFGEMYSIAVGGLQFRNFSNLICGHDGQCDLPDLEVVVETSTGTYAVPADSTIIGLIEGCLSISEAYQG
jgi:hypothetical protein